MSRKRKRRIEISSLGQREAIASTARMELIETLGAAGPSTVAELARRMGRSPHSLYHHVRLLVEAGLLEQVETRRSGAREQAVYDVAAEVFEVPPGSGSTCHDEADVKTVRLILRKAEREFAAALEADCQELRSGAFFTGRMRARLNKRAQKEVMAHLSEIQRIFTRELSRSEDGRSKSRPCSLTAVFLPSPSTDESSS